MNREFLNRAIELSREGMESGEGGPFGAVVVRDGRVISEGWNRVIATNDPSNHAEMIAIRAASRKLNSFDLSDCELYANAEPCPMCVGAIYWARLKKVYFANTQDETSDIGFDDSHIYEELGTPTGERTIPFEHFPDQHARSVFAEWLATEDRAQY